MLKVRPTILNAEPEAYSPRATSILRSVGTLHDLVPGDSSLDSHLPNIHAIIVRLGYQVDSRMLSRATRLRFVATATTGLDHIDLQFAESRGIQVLSLRGEQSFLRSIPATAEHTWGLLLSLTRRLPAAFESVKAGMWDRNQFKGRDVCGKTIGIIGYGRIGQRVARYAAAFGMRVIAYDPYQVDAAPGVTLVPALITLVQQSDIVSLHVPLNDDTTHLLTDTHFGLMKKEACLINTSRGPIVDTRSLLTALRDGSISGAALDVVEDERLAERPLLLALKEYALEHDNLIITPHIGGATIESMESTEIFIARKLAKAFQQVRITDTGTRHLSHIQ